MQVSAFGLDISKEDNGQLKVQPHESPNLSPTSSGEEGETSMEEGSDAVHDGEPAAEPPPSLIDLLGYNCFLFRLYRIIIMVN